LSREIGQKEVEFAERIGFGQNGTVAVCRIDAARPIASCKGERAPALFERSGNRHARVAVQIHVKQRHIKIDICARLQGFGQRRGRLHNPMTQAIDHVFGHHCDQRFVLDEQ